MDGKSLNIAEQKLSKLQEIIPEAFTENKIDWEKLKAVLGKDIEFKNERYVLNWAGKSDAFRVLQSPTTATLVPDQDESINFDSTENVFIEGENLEVLKVLQKSYFGKIKMIYIDPPYNTGNDNFIYLVDDTEMVLILEKIDKEIVKTIVDLKPQKVITIDRLFDNNDQLKTNTTLQMKDAGIEFKVV